MIIEKFETETVAEKQIQDVNWWHESLIEWLLANPDRHLYEAAAHFDRSPAWISVILRSDIFQARFQARLAGHRDLASRSIIEQVEGCAALALEELERRLAQERKSLTFNQVKETAETTAKLLGYGATSRGALNLHVNGGRVQVNQQNNSVHPQVLSRAREKALFIEEQQLQVERLPTLDDGTVEAELLPAST